MATPIIRMDPSKKYSTVHGDRTPDDPHYRVHFMQGGLPFDSNQLLVPDDGKTAAFAGIAPDGKPTMYPPLYDAKMRAALKVRTDRAVSGKAAPSKVEEVSEHDDDEVKRELSEGVNLVSWLRGEEDFEAHMIFAACAERYGRRHTKLRSVVEDLVLDEKIVAETEVAPHLMRLIDTPKSAAA